MTRGHKNHFSLKKLKSFSTRHSKLRYCNSHLTYISRGGARRVYRFKDKVIKVACNSVGQDQNRHEISASKYSLPFLTAIYDHDDKAKFIVAENCYKTYKTEGEDFKLEIFKLTGVPADVFFSLCNFLVIAGVDRCLQDINQLRHWCDIIKYKLKHGFSYKLNRGIKNITCFYETYIGIPHNKINYYLCYFVAFIYMFLKLKRHINWNYNMVFDYIENHKYTTIPCLKDILQHPDSKNINFIDCFNITNVGIVNRNGKDELVILDYGLQNFYRVELKKE